MHPEELLPDFVLGWLEPAQQREIEIHLTGCAQCRQDVRALREGLNVLTDGLPLVQPGPQVWKRIQATLAAEPARPPAQTVPTPVVPDSVASAPAWAERTDSVPAPNLTLPRSFRPRPNWLPLGLAASVALLAVSLLWGVSLSGQQQRLLTDQGVIKDWLADPTVGIKYLREPGQPVQGTALVRVDGTALVVLPAAAPAGKTFQIWGIVKDQRGERIVTSIGLTRGQLAQVSWQGYSALWLSVEPFGGSPQPTQTLGRTPLL